MRIEARIVSPPALPTCAKNTRRVSVALGVSNCCNISLTLWGIPDRSNDVADGLALATIVVVAVVVAVFTVEVACSRYGCCHERNFVTPCKNMNVPCAAIKVVMKRKREPFILDSWGCWFRWDGFRRRFVLLAISSGIALMTPRVWYGGTIQPLEKQNGSCRKWWPLGKHKFSKLPIAIEIDFSLFFRVWIDRQG